MNEIKKKRDKYIFTYLCTIICEIIWKKRCFTILFKLLKIFTQNSGNFTLHKCPRCLWANQRTFFTWWTIYFLQVYYRCKIKFSILQHYNKEKKINKFHQYFIILQYSISRFDYLLDFGMLYWKKSCTSKIQFE